jgi:DNA modification methylase
VILNYKNRVKELRHVPFNELKNNPKNWRKHPQKQKEAMAGVLRSVGWADAVLARETPDGLELIDGHLRKEIAEGDIVPVLILDVTEEEADLILATHDPLAEMATTDQQTLDELITNLDFDDPQTETLLSTLTSIPKELDEVPSPEPSEAAITERGMLYQLGVHRLMCGDSTSPEDLDKLLGDSKAEMLFTDPPYGVDYEGGHFHSGDVNLKRKREKLLGDDTAQIYNDFLPVVIPKVDGACYVWFADSKGATVYTAVKNANCEIHALIIWHKTNATYAAMNEQYKKRHEPCLYFKPKGSTLRWCGRSDEATVWEIKRDAKNEYHPTQKPVALAAKALQNHRAQTVLDCFAGSGSTLIAAEQLNRTCYAMEMNPHYCDVIVKRWEKLTGKKAKKINA